MGNSETAATDLDLTISPLAVRFTNQSRDVTEEDDERSEDDNLLVENEQLVGNGGSSNGGSSGDDTSLGEDRVSRESVNESVGLGGGSLSRSGADTG